MRLHILVEGPSDEALLNRWLPRFLPSPHTFQVIPHRGKGKLSGDPNARPVPGREGLLDLLPMKLRAYASALSPETDRVVVLIDADDDDCLDLKRRMQRVVEACGGKPTCLFRFAVEETEAFYLGDIPAILQAYPRAKLNKGRAYEQDAICGTWEIFAEVIGDDSEDKVAWAERMGDTLGTVYFGPKANRSLSFRHLCTGLLRLVGEDVPSRPVVRARSRKPTPGGDIRGKIGARRGGLPR